MSSNAAVTLHSVVRRCAEVLTAEVGGEVALMSIPAGRYFGLDSTASDVWRHIAQPVRVSVLVETLAALYEGEPEQIQVDVRALLAALSGENLVEFIADGD